MPAAGRLRLLLLERHGARESGWWQQLLQLGGIEGARLEALLDPPEPTALAPITTPDDRRAILQEVMTKASDLEGLDPPLAPPAPGDDAWFDRRLADPAADNSPLLLHMAALAAVQARRSHALDRSRTELALALADDESARLRKLAEGSGIEAGDLQHLVAAVTVEGGADVDGLHRLVDDERRALDLAASHAALRDAVRAALAPVAGDGSATAPQLVDAVRPDLVGEALVLRTWARDDLPADLAHGHVARCWRRAPAATAETLVRLGQDFGARAAAHAPDPDPAPIRWLDRRVEAGDDADLELLVAALPQATVNLRELAERALARLIERLEAAAEPDRLRLAMLRGNRAVRLKDLGRPDLARADEVAARDLFRALVTEVDAATFEPLLATALNNLSVTESNLGRREDALQASEEATDLYRRLAQDRPDAFLPDLASALNNLGIDATATSAAARTPSKPARKPPTSTDASPRTDPTPSSPTSPRPSTTSGPADLSNLGRREDALQASRGSRRLLPTPRPGPTRRLPPRPRR